MNYLLFNKEILWSDGNNVRPINKEDVLSIEQARICVVDVDVLIASAVELPVEKKDSILVRKFNELYQHEPYVIQDEKIDTNLFQVMGIKEQKVREIYSLIGGGQKVQTLLPYGIALRSALIERRVNLNETIVFVDDLGEERLLTVFDDLKFSRTRVIPNSDEDILPEIKRTQIDYSKKIEGYSKKEAKFTILVNSQALAGEISSNKERFQVEFLDLPYPALEGLKKVDTCIQYQLPEEILKKRKQIDSRNNFKTASLSVGLIILGLIFFMFNQVEWGITNHHYHLTHMDHERLEEQLKVLDKETYRESLRLQKTLNYGISYLSILHIIPSSYIVSSFKFVKTNKWNLEMILFPDNDGFIEAIPQVKMLKTAEIKDIFMNNQTGKYLKVIL